MAYLCANSLFSNNMDGPASWYYSVERDDRDLPNNVDVMISLEATTNVTILPTFGMSAEIYNGWTGKWSWHRCTISCNNTAGDVCSGQLISINRHIAGNSSHPCRPIINNWEFGVEVRSLWNGAATIKWSFSMTAPYNTNKCAVEAPINTAAVVGGIIGGLILLSCIGYCVMKSGGCPQGTGTSTGTSTSNDYSYGSTRSYGSTSSSYVPMPKSNWSGGYTIGGQYHGSFNQAEAAGGIKWSA